MEDQFDALLYFSAAAPPVSRISPALCADKSYMEMRLRRLALVASIMPAGGQAAIDCLKRVCAARADDFSGRWQIDVTRSSEKAVALDPAGPPPPAPPPGGPWQALSPEPITRTGEALTIQVGSGPALTFSTDGRESLNTAPDGTSTARRVSGRAARWSPPGPWKTNREVRAHGTYVRWLGNGGLRDSSLTAGSSTRR
jgi:hypothetical protein